ncbi:hypothetical protein EDC04DRAFT_2735240 [Pisolithus marmoratus]|nr:hypothetical protein EDC04DRAFT_2735240 [Pisolithus marmoratus]
MACSAIDCTVENFPNKVTSFVIGGIGVLVFTSNDGFMKIINRDPFMYFPTALTFCHVIIMNSRRDANQQTPSKACHAMTHIL